MRELNREMPPIMRTLHQLEFDYLDDGVDFEPYAEFLSSAETTEWLRAWTGNDAVDGSEYLVFGQDGTGGLAAFWLGRVADPILDQPIVFFGSEGELGVVAKNFASYLWLLAANMGPLEATEFDGLERTTNAHFTQFASEHAPDAMNAPQAIIASARDEFPDFIENIEALCR